MTTITAPDRLPPPGKSRIDLHFAYEGGGEGRGATVTLSVNGQKAGEAHLARTVPKIYSYGETFDVGEDTATAVGPDEASFPFAGRIEKIELRDERAAPQRWSGSVALLRVTTCSFFAGLQATRPVAVRFPLQIDEVGVQRVRFLLRHRGLDPRPARRCAVFRHAFDLVAAP